MSSKFAIPFFQKSPLQGAYSSGAGGMVTISYADVHNKFQNDIATNVAKAYAKENDPCSDPSVVQYTRNSILRKCPKRTKDSASGGGNNFSGESLNNNEAARNAAQSIIDAAIYDGSQGKKEDFIPNIPIKGKKPKVKIKL